jgi:uncharacterized membrane protein HdeD (DUF308 family)
MSTISPISNLRPPAEEILALRDYWRWFLALGIVMVVLGTIAIGWSCLATITVAATWLFGFLLLASGIGEIIHSFWVGRWSGMLLHLLVGVLYTLVGFMIIDQPETAAVQLTLLIAIFLMVGGIFRIVFAVSEQFTGWGWVLLNGAVTFLLGLMIYKQWPSSSLWVIGLFIGIDLIFNGWAWIMLSWGLRRAPAST